MDANQYYQSLIQQGHSSSDAAHFTQQYYPNFEGTAQGMAIMTPPPGSIEMGGMAAGGFGVPAGGMAASGKTMDEIFELAEKKGTYQKEYQKIKSQFLTSYIRSYINRIYEGTTVGMIESQIDEMGGM